MRFRLVNVKYMPKQLKPGILYASEEFGIAVHLCPCGCGSKVRTPLGPTEWVLEKGANGPTLYPSIGNWQFPCQSHYWITDGRVVWAPKWAIKQIDASRRAEDKRRRTYYEGLYRKRGRVFRRFWGWMKGRLKR